jgi:hypothetical protein
MKRLHTDPVLDLYVLYCLAQISFLVRANSSTMPIGAMLSEEIRRQVSWCKGINSGAAAHIGSAKNIRFYITKLLIYCARIVAELYKYTRHSKIGVVPPVKLQGWWDQTGDCGWWSGYTLTLGWICTWCIVRPKSVSLSEQTAVQCLLGRCFQKKSGGRFLDVKG